MLRYVKHPISISSNVTSKHVIIVQQDVLHTHCVLPDPNFPDTIEELDQHCHLGQCKEDRGRELPEVQTWICEMLKMLKLALKHCPDNDGLILLELTAPGLVECVLIGRHAKTEALEAEVLHLHPSGQNINILLDLPFVLHCVQQLPYGVSVVSELEFVRDLANKCAVVWEICCLKFVPVDLFALQIIGRLRLEPNALQEKEANRLEELAALRAWKRLTGKGKQRRRTGPSRGQQGKRHQKGPANGAAQPRSDS